MVRCWSFLIMTYRWRIWIIDSKAMGRFLCEVALDQDKVIEARYVFNDWRYGAVFIYQGTTWRRPTLPRGTCQAVEDKPSCRRVLCWKGRGYRPWKWIPVDWIVFYFFTSVPTMRGFLRTATINGPRTNSCSTHFYFYGSRLLLCKSLITNLITSSIACLVESGFNVSDFPDHMSFSVLTS